MLEIRHTKIFRGPSLWGPVPVILLEVAIGQLEARLRLETPNFFPRLVELVPSLRDFGHLVYQPEGGLQRLLLDRLALALQQQAAQVAHDPMLGAGGELAYARTYPTAEEGRYRVVYAYAQAEVGVAAGALAVRLLNHLLTNGDLDVDFPSELAKLIRVTQQLTYHRTTAIVVAAAERRGIPVERLEQGRGIVLLGNGCHQRRILLGSITSETGLIANRIATDKGLTSHVLREAGLPVPRNVVVTNADDAAAASKRIGYPVVVKPLDASQGRGVTVNVRDEAEVREAFPLAKQHSRRGQVVVERFIPGRNYRILVVNGQVVAVAERVPAHVISDGTHTIAELIEMTNADPRRGAGKENMLLRISVDEQTRKVLARHGLELHDVPEAGRVVPLKPSGSWSTGGTSTDRTDEIHPDNVEIARQAAMVVGLDVAGIDFITPDIARSAYEQGGAIIEVNQQPGLHLETHPQEGTGRDVGGAIIDMLFPPGQPVQVPIVAVTGTNGKTTTTRMIVHIMTTAGKTVGMTTTNGISIAGTQIAAGDMEGARPARKVLRNPAIDYAVLETARGSILRDGLGFAHRDVAVVTNVAADHLGQRGIETVPDMATVKAVVPGAVVSDGASVLNADDPSTVEMARVAGGEILFFSLDEQNPVIAQHVGQGGRAVVLRQTEAGELLTLRDGEEETEILLAEEIPATMEGRIRVNIANALAAAAALAQEVPPETIRSALRGFANSAAQTPGRFNVLAIEGRTVVVDYFHNAHGLEAMADFVTRMGAPYTVAVIQMAGDRTDEHIAAFGRLAAEIFDELVIRDPLPNYRRRRKPGEVSARLRAAALAGGLAPDKVTLMPDHDELKAVQAGIAKAGKDGLVVLHADDAAAVWSYLMQRQEAETAV